MPALLGLIIYWLVIGTSLERMGTLSLVWLAVFVMAIAQRREDRAYPWIAASLAVSTTWQFITELAHERRWQTGYLHSIALIGNVIYVISAVCFGVAVLIWIRTSGRSLLRRLLIRIRP